jgi:hypothetical protein
MLWVLLLLFFFTLVVILICGTSGSVPLDLGSAVLQF